MELQCIKLSYKGARKERDSASVSCFPNRRRLMAYTVRIFYSSSIVHAAVCSQPNFSQKKFNCLTLFRVASSKFEIRQENTKQPANRSKNRSPATGRRTTHCWIYVDRICWKKEEKRHRWNLPCTSIGIRTVTLRSPGVKPGPFQQLPLRSGLRAQRLSVDREGGYIQVQGSDT